MEDETLITVNSKKYVFPKINYETNQSYSLRKNFFLKNLPKSEKEYLNIINLSLILRGILFLNCVYPEKVVENLNKYLGENEKIKN